MMIGGSGDGAAFAAAELISLWVWIHTQSRALRRVHVVKPLTLVTAAGWCTQTENQGCLERETLRTTLTPLNPRAGFVMPLL